MNESDSIFELDRTVKHPDLGQASAEFGGTEAGGRVSHAGLGRLSEGRGRSAIWDPATDAAQVLHAGYSLNINQQSLF